MMKWCFWLLFFPLAAAMNSSYLFRLLGYLLHPFPKWEHTWSSDGKTPWKKSPPGRATQCLWRTEKPQNCTRKMPKVTSETSCFCRNFCCCCCWSPDGKTPCLWRTEKRQNCTPKMPNVTSETDRKWCFWLLFPLAAAMNFGYLYIRSPNGKTPWKKSPPGSKTPCLWRTEKPQNCTSKMPNVTSETDRKWCFWLLFPLAAAMNFGYLYIRSPNGKTPWKKSPPGSKTPCLWRTEKPQLHLENA